MYYIGLDSIVTGSNQFDWSVLDNTLADAATRSRHVILRAYCLFPGLAVPKYFIKAATKLVRRSDGELSPQYATMTNQPNACHQFNAALEMQFDGHKSLGFIRIGLLENWCVFHSQVVDVLQSPLPSKTHSR